MTQIKKEERHLHILDMLRGADDNLPMVRPSYGDMPLRDPVSNHSPHQITDVEALAAEAEGRERSSCATSLCRQVLGQISNTPTMIAPPNPPSEWSGVVAASK